MAIPRLLIFFMLVNDGKEVRSISSTMFMNVQERPTVMHMQWMHIRTLCDTIWYTYSFFFLQDKNAQYSQDNLPYWLKTTIKYNEDHAARLGQKVREDYCSRGSFNFFFFNLNLCCLFCQIPTTLYVRCSLLWGTWKQAKQSQGLGNGKQLQETVERAIPVSIKNV